MSKITTEQDVSTKIEFLAITGFGWAYADSPAMAIQKAQSNISYGAKPRKGSKKWEEAQDKIQLWMVPSNCHGTENFRPVDEDGNPVGILLHGHYKPEDKVTQFGVMDKAIKGWLEKR
tara:strand:+ start:1056 stop:1409 length:354 start_codon:yes stop_codon:yes gene_type:complete